MKKNYASRHAPAFILLFLARDANYGGALLAAMEREMPFFLGDSAMIYRTLHDLEGEGCVTTYWDTQDSGPPKKFYRITNKGWQRLLEFAADIQQRQQNFAFFLKQLESLRHQAPRLNEEEQHNDDTR